MVTGWFRSPFGQHPGPGLAGTGYPGNEEVAAGQDGGVETTDGVHARAGLREVRVFVQARVMSSN